MGVMGLGIFLIQPRRINDLIASYGDRFISKFFLEPEIAYSKSTRYPYLHLATRFAAKQAFKKALGVKAGDIVWHDVEVIRELSGTPKIKLHRRALQISIERGVGDIHVSLSHTDELGVAMVVLTERESRLN